MPSTPRSSSRCAQPSRSGLSRKKSQMPANTGPSRPVEPGVDTPGPGVAGWV